MKNISNLTLLMPSFCNANCSFCPERWDVRILGKSRAFENMPNFSFQKMQYDWLNEMVLNITRLIINNYYIENITVSGGEPTLYIDFLGKVLESITSLRGKFKTELFNPNVGLISNGQFLNDSQQIGKMLHLSRKHLDYFNISMHSLNREQNNAIMCVTNVFEFHDIHNFFDDINTERNISCQVNCVVTRHTNVPELISSVVRYFQKVSDSGRDSIPFAFAFRTDYRLLKNIVKKNEMVVYPAADSAAGVHRDLFSLCTELFGEYDEGHCPSCISLTFRDVPVILKGSCFEPTQVEEPFEKVFHMDGKLYNDWSREQPVYLEFYKGE